MKLNSIWSHKIEQNFVYVSQKSLENRLLWVSFIRAAEMEDICTLEKNS